MISEAVPIRNRTRDYSNLDAEDRRYIDSLRGALILRVVLAHLGLSWFFLPYSSYIGMFFPALFAVSGIVSFYSFLRSRNVQVFLTRRLARLYITYIVITALAFAILLTSVGTFAPNFYAIVDWALMNMSSEVQPYNLGQVWFLRSLVVITILAVPFFLLSRLSIHFLLIPVGLSVALAIWQSCSGIGSMLWIRPEYQNAFNLYQPLVNFGYYMFGGWLFISGAHKSTNFGSSLLVVLSAMLLVLIITQDIDPDLRNHSYYQDIFYMILGYIGIVGLFLFRPFLSRLFAVRAVGSFLRFFSFHAFVIYLTHSFFIDISESVFGWEGVGSKPVLAVAKIAFVLAASCLTAIPLSWVTKKITRTFITFARAH